MKRDFYFFPLFMAIIACIYIFSSCSSTEKKVKEYESPFSLGEGMTYRSMIFKVARPSLTPFPMKINDKYEYSRDTHGTHMEHCTEPVFDVAKPFTEDLGAVKASGKWGYIRLVEEKKREFEYAINPIFQSAEPFSEGLAAVKQDNRYGYIDLCGNMVIKPRFISAHYFQGGIAAVETDESWTFIDKNGEQVFKTIFECAESFAVVYTLKDGKYIPEDSKTFAPVKIKGKWGYINLKGQIVIEPIFDEAWVFDHDGRAAVKIKNRWKYIDTKGNVIGNIR